MEQWFVLLNDQFQATQISLEKMIEKLNRGDFFRPEDFSEMASVLEAQRHLQEQCVEQLSQRELISPEDGKDMSLQRLETLVRQAGEREALEEKKRGLRELVRQFASVQAEDPAYRADLEEKQNQLSAQSDDQLLDLEQVGALQAYRDFLDDLRRTDLQYQDVKPLADTFGSSLALALLGHELTLPVGDVLPVKPELPGTEQRNFKEKLLLVRADLSELGALCSEKGHKIPKGVKVFQNLARHPWEQRALLYVASNAASGFFSKNMLLWDVPSQDAETITRFVDLLLKEGYLIQYFLESSPEKCLYSATPEGLDIFSKDDVRKHLKTRLVSREDLAIINEYDFLRRWEGLHTLYGICQGKFSCYAVCAQHHHAGCFLTIQKQEGAPVSCVVLPALAYGEKELPDQAESCFAELRDCMQDTAEDVSIFAAVWGQPDVLAVQKLVREQLALPEQAQIYVGTVGTDRYADAQGQECSLMEHLGEVFPPDSGGEGLVEQTASVDVASEETALVDMAEDSGSPTDTTEGATGGEGEPQTESADAEVAQGKRGQSGDDPDTPPDSPDCRIDIQTATIQENAGLLLECPEQIELSQMLELTVQLISQNQFAACAVLLGSLSGSPRFGKKVQPLYHAFQQCVHQPGGSYRFNSGEINAQQSSSTQMAILAGSEELRGFYRTMVLANLLWALLFPSDAYDYSLYNSTEMLFGDEMRATLGNETIKAVQGLTNLLCSDLKKTSFQCDGLGFSAQIISMLVDSKELEQARHALSQRADALLKSTPKSTVGINGLETCLKQMVGPSSEIGQALRVVAEDRVQEVQTLWERLKENLGLKDAKDVNEWLEEYIDANWNQMRHDDAQVKLKRLDNDSPGRRTCEKALTDRLKVIREWSSACADGKASNFQKYRESYARIRNQVKNGLQELAAQLEGQTQGECWQTACQNLLLQCVRKIQAALDGAPAQNAALFYQELWMTPELIIDDSGEPVTVLELYEIPGLEPWVFCLYSLAAPAEAPKEILARIGDYTSKRWYRNFGTERLLCRLLEQEAPDRSEARRLAKADMAQESEEFKGRIRLDQAYGKLQEHLVETVFSILQVVQEAYEETESFAGFRVFLDHLQRLLDRKIQDETRACSARVEALKRKPEYAASDWIPVIEAALRDGRLDTVETYINAMQSGQRDLPSNVKTRSRDWDFLIEFRKCEAGYFQECQRHKGDTMANWGRKVLERMGTEFQHWSTPNERANSPAWLDHWIKGRGSFDTPRQIKELLTGLGFTVIGVPNTPNQSSRHGTGVAYECYLADVEPTSTRRTDYPHPVAKFGTGLSRPMNVVCLYGCPGVSTLLDVMTNKLQLSGSTIVLMDGSLSARERQQMAKEFKTSTSGQNSFLLIDRVLALYLASLDRGDRQVAMLRCTLPYTFEVLYNSSGSGAIPEEMFIGRTVEMQKLCSEQGPDLVYGGRQLGKTALLTRVSNILNNPAQREYSFCVDVKDIGSGTLLEHVNKRLMLLKLIDTPCTSLEDLCETLKVCHESGKIHSMRIFVDEVDCLFDEFRANNYKTLRPFITLRDDTKHKVKFVFAGTHNVAATDIAEKDNSNLLHMGKPLCIKPFSNNDAIDLIQIPMSYLGFEIGTSQIELILSNTNNYPGLIHMFCSALIQAICRDYDQLCTEDGNYPPYHISDAQMEIVFREQDIRKEIGKRVMATIELNYKYNTVAHLLAQMTCEDQENHRHQLYGYSAKEMKAYNLRELHLPLIETIPEKDLNTLVEEMENMGILWKNQGTQQFRFRRNDFMAYIEDGDSEKILDALLSWPDPKEATVT